MRRKRFHRDELVRVDCEFVVLASGGPLMRIEAVEGEKAIVRYSDGQTRRRLLPIACLCKLVPVTEAEARSYVTHE